MAAGNVSLDMCSPANDTVTSLRKTDIGNAGVQRCTTHDRLLLMKHIKRNWLALLYAFCVIFTQDFFCQNVFMVFNYLYYNKSYTRYIQDKKYI